MAVGIGGADVGDGVGASVDDGRGVSAAAVADATARALVADGGAAPPEHAERTAMVVTVTTARIARRAVAVT
jgi:hypothetical protein